MSRTESNRCTSSPASASRVWIDSLSREMLESGQLAGLMADDAVTGVTSNPTIFQKALAEGDALRRAAAGAASRPRTIRSEIFIQLAAHDVSNACDLMRDVWDDGAGLRGYVSIEVDPTLAYDTEATYDQAKRLHG